MTTTASAHAGDPFERIREELVAAAARSVRRRRRRRRTAIVVALAALGLAAAAGAAAVADFSTGVPAIDALLANDTPGPRHPDWRPGPGGASEPIPLPNAPDGRGAAIAAYLSRDGNVCRAMGDFRRRDGAPRGTDGGGCFPPADLARMLEARTAFVMGSMHSPDMRIYDGFAAADVVALRFRTDGGRTFEARLAPRWAPAAPGAVPVRLFTAVDHTDIDGGGDGVQVGEEELLFERYRAEATLRDGRVIEIRTP